MHNSPAPKGRSMERDPRENDAIAGWKRSWADANPNITYYAVKRLRGIKMSWLAAGAQAPISDVNELINEAWIWVMRRERSFDPTKQTAFRFWQRAIDACAQDHRDKGGTASKNLTIVSTPVDVSDDPVLLRMRSFEVGAASDDFVVADFLRFVRSRDEVLFEIALLSLRERPRTLVIADHFGKSERWAREKKRQLEMLLDDYLGRVSEKRDGSSD